jgi:hypothetical protein
MSTLPKTEPGLPVEVPYVLGLRPGERVRVRPADEIFATLDEKGTLEGLPFMPEMLKYCGRVLPVTQRADATCAGNGLIRRMENAVHLRNIRCDGSFHDGCQAACLMYWKEAWLERAEQTPRADPRELEPDEQAFVEETLIPAIKVDEDHYACQATEIPKASRPVRLRETAQYRRAHGNWKWPKLIKGLFFEAINQWQSFSHRRLPSWLQIAGGARYPFVIGKLNKGETPKGGHLDLQAGDLVRIKSKQEIVATLDKDNKNRGLFFDHEMARYCGRVARVQGRVTKLIEESNGEMIEIKSDCILLEGVFCTADYHLFCTRAIHSYWRELWLEKIEDPDVEPTTPCVNRWTRA